MKRIRNAHYGILFAGVMLLAPGTKTFAQKHSSPGTTTVPPIDGSPLQLPSASESGNIRNTTANNPTLDSLNDTTDSTVRRNMEAIRFHVANVERHKALTREAQQLLQLAAELQLKIASNASGPPREEALRQIDTIEKLAHNVKERMKGAR